WWRRHQLPSEKDRDWQRLLEGARDAEPDPSRSRIREATRQRDVQKVRDLVLPEVEASLPPPTLVSFALALDEACDREEALACLERAQRRHPGELVITTTLASFCERTTPPRLGVAVRLRAAALALRPRSAAMHAALITSRMANRDFDGALASSDEA